MSRDPLDASRIGALPNAGYATHREKELSDLVMQFMREIERDRIALLLIVIGGKTLWRQQFQKAARGLKPPDSLCDAIYGYFALQAGANPLMQLDVLLELKRNPRLRYGL